MADPVLVVSLPNGKRVMSLPRVRPPSDRPADEEDADEEDADEEDEHTSTRPTPTLPPSIPFRHANFDRAAPDLLLVGDAGIGKSAIALETIARMLSVHLESETFKTVSDSGAAAKMPVDFLARFHSSQLSDRERAQWQAKHRVQMWSMKCLLAELSAASTMFAKTELCYAPSPKGVPWRPASSGKGHCALLMLATFIPDNGPDPNVYHDGFGSYATARMFVSFRFLPHL